MVQVDWNATVWILDTLSEGMYSFTELDDYVCRQYGRDVVRASLALLAGQNLIRTLEDAPNDSQYDELGAEERGRRIESFFEIAAEERRSSVKNWIDLTAAGKDVLRLIGIGCRPL